VVQAKQLLERLPISLETVKIPLLTIEHESARPSAETVQVRFSRDWQETTILQLFFSSTVPRYGSRRIGWRWR
jgi:hypothetical protein